MSSIFIAQRDLMYISYVICLTPLIPAAYGGRYRSTLAFTLLYVLFLYTLSILTIVYVSVTLLLRMLYVLSFHYTSMLMVRYYSYYTVVTYDICVMASVGR